MPTVLSAGQSAEMQELWVWQPLCNLFMVPVLRNSVGCLRHNAEVCKLSSLQTQNNATRLCASSSGAALGNRAGECLETEPLKFANLARRQEIPGVVSLLQPLNEDL